MLWCLIYEPNGIIHEMHLNKNAKGHECFDKVCILRFCFGQGKPNSIRYVDDYIFHLSCQKKISNGICSFVFIDLWKAKALRTGLFRFEIQGAKRDGGLVKFTKQFVRTSTRETAVPLLVSCEIFRKTSRNTARNKSVSQSHKDPNSL